MCVHKPPTPFLQQLGAALSTGGVDAATMHGATRAWAPLITATPPGHLHSTHQAALQGFPGFFLLLLFEVVALFAMTVVQTSSGTIETVLYSSKV